MPRPLPVRTIGALLAALLAAVLGVAACTSTTNGVGSVRRFPAPPFTPPGSVNPGGPNSPVPSGSGSGTRPPNCDPATCHQRLSASLNPPYAVSVWADDGSTTTYVVLASGGAPASFATLAGESPAQLSCVNQGTASNCVLVDQASGNTLAHLVRVDNGALVMRAFVRADTTTMQAKDMNADGWVDVAGLQKNSAGYYWQTWTSDGVLFHSTGCSAPPADQAAPTPSVPLTASCP